MLSTQVALCPQSPSLSTLDLSHESNSNLPHLLADSVSLGSLWSLASDIDTCAVPAFPLGCMIPMFNVGFKSNLETLAGDRGVEGLFEHNSRPNVTITVPTPPRLRTMLQENICVKKWAVSLSLSAHIFFFDSPKQNITAVKPPGHRPWGTAIRAKVSAWTPEGSMHTPEAFRGALASTRYRSGDSDCDSPVPFPARHRISGSYRDALVFEREITLRTGDTTQRWSLQVPASSMKPEMVDMMLELRNLNSFFKRSVESDTIAESVLQPCVGPPALVVSNSQSVMPLSLESSAALDRPDSPEIFLPLAERRGKKLPAQLRCEPAHLRNSYPGIPTPFLGTPSAYSPDFELSSNKRTSMNLKDMISSLRNQGTILHDKSDTLIIEEEPLVNHLPLPLTPTTPASALADDDDWAFADGLLDRYSHSSTIGDPVAHAELRLDESLVEVVTTDIADVDDPSSRLNDNAAGESVSPELRPCEFPHYPSIATSMSPPRSILKRCKNVRFASLPRDKRLSIFPIGHSIPRPSVTATSQTQADAASEAPRPSLEAAGLERSERSAPPRPLSLAPPVPAFVQKISRTSPRTPFRKASSPPINSRPVSQPHVKPTGRHSLGGMINSADKENKEGKGRASFSPKAVSRLTLDENTFRRGNGNGSSKSRMPVPLRNILTRFK